MRLGEAQLRRQDRGENICVSKRILLMTKGKGPRVEWRRKLRETIES